MEDFGFYVLVSKLINIYYLVKLAYLSISSVVRHLDSIIALGKGFKVEGHGVET
jgi:hypothetical protein